MVGLPIPINDKKPRFADMVEPTIIIVLGSAKRFLYQSGGYCVRNGICYLDVILKVNFDMTAVPWPNPDSQDNGRIYSSGVVLPKTKDNISAPAEVIAMTLSGGYYSPYSIAVGYIVAKGDNLSTTQSGLQIGIAHDITASTNNIYVRVKAEYETTAADT